MKLSNIKKGWISTLLGLVLWAALGAAYAYALDIPELVQIAVFLAGLALLPSSWFDEKIIGIVKGNLKK